MTQKELSEVFGVSRQTLYSWRQGSPASNKMIVQRAERMCRAIDTAVTTGTLPLTFDVAPASRMSKIKLAMLGK
jgi:transcriptional regulator with XRE-family HTH domain